MYQQGRSIGQAERETVNEEPVILGDGVESLSGRVFIGGTKSRPELAGLGSVRSKLKACGITGPGSDWIIGCLDPVGETRGRMPGQSGVHSVFTRFEQLHTIGYDTSGIGGAWDLCIIQGGGDNTILQYAAGPAGTDFNTLDGPTASAGVFAGRMEAVATPPTSLVTLTGQNGVPAQYGVQGPARAYQATKRTSASVTAYYVGPKLTAAGTVFCTRVPYYPGGEVAAMAPSNRLPIANYRTQPLSLREEELIMQGAPPFTADASIGVYATQLTTATELQPVNALSGQIVRPSPEAGPYWLTDMGQTHALADSPMYVSSSTYAPIPWLYGYPLSDSAMGDSSTTVIIFRGLPHDAKILVKGVLSVEGVPTAGSPERPFITPPNPYDYRALALYTELVQQLPNGYPSECNFLGAVGSFIAKAASSLWGLIKPVALPAARAALGEVASITMEKTRARPLPAAEKQRESRSVKTPKQVVEVIETAPRRPRRLDKVKIKKEKPRLRVR